MAAFPEKCPFCGKPVEDDEPTCRQCGFDLDSDWQPASADEAEGVFDPRFRACSSCGALNPVTANTCASCHLLMGGDPLGIDPRKMIAQAITGARTTGPEEPETRKAAVLRRAMAIVLIVGGLVFLCLGLAVVPAAGWKALAIFAPFVVLPIGFALLLLWPRGGADRAPREFSDQVKPLPGEPPDRPRPGNGR